MQERAKVPSRSSPHAPPLGFPDLDRGKNTLDETLAVTLEHSLDPRYIDEIVANSDDHIADMIRPDRDCQA